jgi:hypothetical protein
MATRAVRRGGVKRRDLEAGEQAGVLVRDELEDLARQGARGWLRRVGAAPTWWGVVAAIPVLRRPAHSRSSYGSVVCHYRRRSAQNVKT